MKLMRSALALMFVAASVVACDDDPTGDDRDVSDLAGVYTVQTFEYEADDGSSSLDLATFPAAQGGPLGITEMEVETDGSFSGEMKLPVEGTIQTFTVGGEIELTGGNNIRIDFDAFTDALEILDDFEDGTYSLSGDNLTLVLPDVTFDYTLAGNTAVDSDLTIVASR